MGVDFDGPARGVGAAEREGADLGLGAGREAVVGGRLGREHDAGAVERGAVLPRLATQRAGDLMIGIASSGPHSNGYSLIRKIIDRSHSTLTDTFNGETLGSALLKPTKIYVKSLLSLLDKVPVHAFAHITGGGFVDNIPRVLPKSLDVVIKKGSWDMLPIFRIIAEKSGVPDAELYQVFNMGIGMVAIVSADQADAVLKFINGQKHDAWLIGEVVKGSGETKVV